MNFFIFLIILISIIQMQQSELNSLSIAIKNIPSSSSINNNNKLIIEVVGTRYDMYQNILPLLFDVTFISNHLNEYNQSITINKSNCILLDGPGKQYTTSDYYIEYNRDKKEYTLVKKEVMDILEPFNYFKENGLYFY
jgi:hypothetical protein